MEKQKLCLARGFFLLIALTSLAACQQATPRPIGPATPTPPIRHRDALPLLLTAEDLGSSYKVVDQQRLDKGKGWGDDSTRLSGYRHEYQGSGTFNPVVVQVECYLSVKDAQGAYRAYKAQLLEQLRAGGKYTSINEAETRGLGEWGAALTMQDTADANIQTIHYLFLRENVLVELALTAPKSAALGDQALKQAQVVDQRISAR